MDKNCFLCGKKIYLKLLTENDVSDEYLKWMNDSDVVKYTESRFFPSSYESLVNYLKHANNNNNTIFSIMDMETSMHIGNIKLGGINWIHRTANIGLIIGNKDFWGKGIATEAIGLVTEYAFQTLNLRKIIAGAYQDNIGSIRAFEKNGFTQSHIEKEMYFFEGRYIDAVVLEKFNSVTDRIN